MTPEFNTIEPPQLQEYIDVVVNTILVESKEKFYCDPIQIDELGKVQNNYDTLRKIFDYLVRNGICKSFDIQHVPELSYEGYDAIPYVIIHGIDHEKCQRYSGVVSALIAWCTRHDFYRGREPVWFAQETLFYYRAGISLEGFQAKLCEALFDHGFGKQLRESDVIEFVTGSKDDVVFDIKDLVKQVNRKARDQFGIPQLIHRKNGLIYAEY